MINIKEIIIQIGNERIKEAILRCAEYTGLDREDVKIFDENSFGMVCKKKGDREIIYTFWVKDIRENNNKKDVEILRSVITQKAKTM